MILQVNVPSNMSSLTPAERERIIVEVIRAVSRALHEKGGVSPGEFIVGVGEALGLFIGMSMTNYKEGLPDLRRLIEQSAHKGREIAESLNKTTH